MKKTITTLFLTLTLTLAWSINAQATAYDEANWYFSVDIEQVRSKIMPLIPKHKDAHTDFSINEHLPTEVHYVTAYGHSEAEDDLSLVLKGDFSSFTLNDFINDLMYLVEEDKDVNIALFNTYTVNGQVVEEFRVEGGKENKSFFSSKLDNQTIVVSLDEAEVKNWANDDYSGHDLNSSGMVSLLVNIESAMAHMGADLSSNSKPFNSEVFKKITQFSASLYESEQNINIDAALSTADDATAKQLEQVINGLIAMNALSNMNEDKPVLAALLSGLVISNQGNDLLISSFFPMNMIKELDID